MTDQGLETEADRVRVCRGTRRKLRFAKKLLIDMQGLLHTDDHAIRVWQKQPGTDSTGHRALYTTLCGNREVWSVQIVEMDLMADRKTPEQLSSHPALSSCSKRSASHIRARVVASVVRWRASLLKTAFMAGGRRMLS